jgi:hypothetical protein
MNPQSNWQQSSVLSRIDQGRILTMIRSLFYPTSCSQGELGEGRHSEWYVKRRQSSEYIYAYFQEHLRVRHILSVMIENLKPSYGATGEAI